MLASVSFAQPPLLRALIVAVALLAGLAALHPSSAAAQTEGQAIVGTAQAVQAASYPAESFASASYIYCFDGGTISRATAGGNDGSPAGTPAGGPAYSDCADMPAGNPDRVGFDCRGLVLYSVYQGTGGAVNMSSVSGTAQEQYSDAASYGGSDIALSSVQPGDLVFFGGSSSTVSHVGVVVSGIGNAAEIISAIDEGDGIATHPVSWFAGIQPGQFAWDGAVAVPGVTNTSGGGSAPAISSAAPNQAAVGTQVTLTGSGLNGASAVSFNGTPATINSDTDTTLVTTVPSGATSGGVTVTTSGGSATTPFIVDDGSSEDTAESIVNQSSYFNLTLAQGPNDSLDAYWNTIGQAWNGPSVVGGDGTTFSAPAMVMNPTTNFVMAVVEGPNNSLDAYWDTIGQPWDGPEQVGAAGTTYSAPTVVLNQGSDFVAVVVEGPNNSLDAYWDTIGQPWNGPAQVAGPGTTYSAPASVLNAATNFESAVVEGPNNTLDDYWVTIGQPWNGPAQVGPPGSTYSAPATVLNQGTDFQAALAEGPNNTLDDYWVTIGQPWNGPAQVGGAGSTYSQPTTVLDPGTNFESALVEGPNNSLDDYWVTIGQPWNGPATVAGPSSTYAVIGQMLLHPASTLVGLTQGPSNTLDSYWVQLGQPWNGPGLVGGDGNVFAYQPPAPTSGGGGSAGGASGGSTGSPGQSSGTSTGTTNASRSTPLCVVPRLKHLTLAETRRALKRRSCRLGKVVRPRRRAHYATLRVSSQRPAPGTRRAVRTRVNVTLH